MVVRDAGSPHKRRAKTRRINTMLARILNEVPWDCTPLVPAAPVMLPDLEGKRCQWCLKRPTHDTGWTDFGRGDPWNDRVAAGDESILVRDCCPSRFAPCGISITGVDRRDSEDKSKSAVSYAILDMI